MKSYKVLVKRINGWFVTDHNLNKLAAEVIRDYYIERGNKAKIEEE